MSVEQRGAASSVQIHQVDLKLTDTFIAEIRDVLTMCGGCLQLHSLWTILTAAVGGSCATSSRCAADGGHLAPKRCRWIRSGSDLFRSGFSMSVSNVGWGEKGAAC